MTGNDTGPFSRTVHLFERVMVVSLLVMMMLVIVLAAIDLGWIIIQDIITPPIILLEIGELLEIFGLFLLILIGIELLETIKVYFETRRVGIDIVLEVAMIAIARKVIVLEADEYGGVTVLGIAALVLALGAGYYLVRRARQYAANEAR